jgi:L-gulonolactone oxidase
VVADTALESIAGEVGGRPHWGQLHGLGSAGLQLRYPRYDDFVALRDELDPLRAGETPTWTAC